MAEPAAGDDWGLYAQARERRSAMATLFERHKDYVYRLAWGFVGEPQLADDVTQEVFLRLAQGRRAVPRARFTTWLYKVTLNVARELGRRRAREVLAGDPADLGPRPSSTAGRDPLLLDLGRALATLPMRQREVVVMRYLEGCSTREAAHAMGCREGTVKAHLHRALAALRRVFGDGGRSTASESKVSIPENNEIPLHPQRRES